MTDTPNRRSGGRSARRAARAAPLEAAERPIRPGMTGGTLKVLTDAKIERIHRAALQALKEIGLADGAVEDGFD